jgi:S-(hydroxymethyl)glutathione dehydrogenase/alcohol dehydrogenase
MCHGLEPFPLGYAAFHRDFYMRGLLKLDLMISGRVRLDQINEAYAQLKTGEIARNVIEF